MVNRNDTLVLYHASVTGSIDPSLEALIKEDPLFLTRVRLISGISETALHISASYGHLEFSKTILGYNRGLAEKLDSVGRYPLHLASEYGHKEVVHVLLQVSHKACLSHDLEERIPLHYAAMEGRVDVVEELIRAKPESIAVEDGSGETSLQLCVRHNHLDCLKILVKEVEENSDLLSSGSGSDASRTILWLAKKQKRTEIIKYLVSLPAISNHPANKAVLDTLQRGNRDIRVDMEPIPMDSQQVCSNITGLPWLWMKFMECLHYEKGDDWLQEMRGMLTVVATVISTMTFQAAINPPGGFWQDKGKPFSIDGEHFCVEENSCFPGTAVLGSAWAGSLKEFIRYNTISFVASLIVTILLISGFPLTNGICIWFLSIALCVTITFAGLAYITGVFLVMPDSVALWISTECKDSVSLVWIVLLAMVGAFRTFRFLTWLVNKVKKVRC